jgi:hypothetical protein
VFGITCDKEELVNQQGMYFQVADMGQCVYPDSILLDRDILQTSQTMS